MIKRKMNKISNIKKTLMIIVILSFLFVLTSFSQKRIKDDPMPPWLRKHMEYMTKESGNWIFGNFGQTWKWGAGKKSIKGSLYSLKNGDVGPVYWEFLIFWHPAENKVIYQQLGATGRYGVGELKSLKSENDMDKTVELMFYDSNGKSWKELYNFSNYGSNGYSANSFIFEGNDWVKRGTYQWRRRN